MEKRYQIFIMNTSKTGILRRLSFSTFQLRVLLGIFVFCSLCLCVFIFDYTMAVSKQAELKRLRSENQELNRHIHVIKEKVSDLESSFQRVEDFSYKLKSIMNRENFGTAIGPLPSDYQHYLESSRGWEERFSRHELVDPFKKKSLIEINKSFENYLSLLQEKSHFLQKNIWFVIGILDENRHLMSITPSIQPARGWVTSRFGFRDYPFSKSKAHFHRGLDIAAKEGTEVVASADAVVSSTGYDLSTGNYVILNHGYNLETLYGHLESAGVKEGQKVVRGEKIGTLGNTGRSTGPHLHYEVRISGQPVDPEYYILDSL